MSSLLSACVYLGSERCFGVPAQRNRPDCPKNPAQIRNECSAREVGQIDFRFGWEHNLSIELRHRDPGGIELAFVLKHDLTRPEEAGLVLMNLLESVAKAVAESKRLGSWPHDRHVAPQYVPQLWHFVQLACGKEATDRCQTVVF